jgi:hypothetical protein
MHKSEMSGAPVIQEIETALSVLFKPGQVMEVRAITDDGVASGYFNDPSALANAVSSLDTLPGVQGIYVTLNEVNPALLSRRANRIKMRLSKKDTTTADADIIRRRWLPIDVDPVRPSGVSSTEAEHNAAIVKADRIATYLADLGWPAPVVADSGNGAHLLYLIDLPNDETSRDLVKKCLEVLAVMFDDPESTIDTTVHNPARIWKLYGTMCRKGDNTRDRPHRRAMARSLPGVADSVSDTLLVRLAESLPVAPVNPRVGTSVVRGHGRSADLGTWLHEHGLGVSSEKQYQGGTLFTFQQCPFSGDHKDGAFAIQFGNGAIFAGCHHASCGGGVQRWPELRETFEPKVARNKVTPDPPQPLPPLPAPGLHDIPAIHEAMAVLEHGDPLQAMLDTFALDHVGDETVAACLVMSLASRSVINTVGLHVSVTGESGKGKSHAFSKMLLQVPQRFRLSGRMSNKALFYLENLVPGMVIVLDDTTLSEEMQEVLKGVTTSFNEPFEYRTVNKDRKPQVCMIPERCTWWIAKVEGSGDDQVFNRMLTCWIDDTADQDDRVLACILAKDSDFPVADEVEQPELAVCRAMWEVLGRQRLYVRVPFSEQIEFQSRSNRRNSGMLLDLIKAHALLRFMQRELTQVGEVRCITATFEDFTAAARLFELLNGSAGGQTTKLTKKESDLLAVIARHSWPEFTTSMLQKATGLSNAVVYRTMHGYITRGYAYSGLLEKCPAIAYTDRTVVCDENDTGISMRRRTNAYTFDDALYHVWCSGGSVWLRNDPGGKGGQTTETSCTKAESFRVDQFPQEAPGSGIDAIPTHSCTNNLLYYGKSDLTETSEGTCDIDSSTHREVQNSVRLNRGTRNLPPICENVDVQPGISTRKIPHDVREHAPIPPGEIYAGDYRKADYPDRLPCACCGRRGDSWFIEKLPRERVSNPALPARRLCRTCHRDALLKEQASGVPLTGILPVGSMTKVDRDLGRCSVCNIGSAAWYDEATKVKLCDYCYNREIARQSGGSEQEGTCQ